MTTGQDGETRPEMMMQTLNPVDSQLTSDNFDLLADSVSCSQWPTLPMSPTRGNVRPGGSFLDGSPTRDGMRHLADSLDTLPRGTSYRLPGLVESEFNLLEASEVIPSTETPLLEPAIEHAADACPSSKKHRSSQHHRKAHEAVGGHSITLPQPPEDSEKPPADDSLQFPPSPASSLLLSSGGATDGCTATQYTGSVRSRSKQWEPCSSPVPASVASPEPPLPPPPMGTPLRPDAVGISKLHASERAQRALAPHARAVAPPPAKQHVGQEGVDVNRSPVSDATVVSASSENSPPWMSSAAPAEHPLGVLAPQRGSMSLWSNNSSLKLEDSESNMQFQSCMSSVISSSTMPSNENVGILAAPQALGWQRKAVLPLTALDKRTGSARDYTAVGAMLLGAHGNQAWSNPIYRSRSTNTDLLDSLGSHPAASGPVSSYQECTAADDATENDQNPTNDTSRHQSQILDSQALDSSVDAAVAGDSGVVPDAICSILDKIDDMEKHIACGWQEEQALRAHEEASFDDVASRKQITSEPSGTAAALSPQQLSVRSGLPSQQPPQSPVDVRVRPEDPDAAMASSSQATLPPLSSREPLSPSVAASETRNWEEHALELQAQVAAAHLQAQQDREALETQLRELQSELQQEQLLRSHTPTVAPAGVSTGDSLQTAGPHNNSGSAGEGAVPASAPATDDATALVSEAQNSVKRLEEVVSTGLEPLVSHIAGMKRRMLSAQEEAGVLREEVQTAERRTEALEKKLEEVQKQSDDDSQNALMAAWAPRAQQQVPASPRAAPESIVSLRTPRAHASEEDMSVLLKQLQAANAESKELKKSVAGLQERQGVLQALLDDRSGDTGTVPMSEHQQVLSQNKQLQAQLQQLRMDLELLYMDDQFVTGANEGASMGTDPLAPAGAPTSFMSTVHRLGVLLGVAETQRPSQSNMRRMAMNTLPQLSETDQVETPESTSPLRPIRNFSTNGPLPTMAAGGAEPSNPSGQHSPHSPGSPLCAPVEQDVSMLDGPVNPGGSVMSMFRSMDRSALTVLREHTAERLATTVQQQAGALVEKDQQIAALEQRVSDLEAPQALGKECGESNSADDGHAWESLPPPESFKEALEQILMLQVENSRLSCKLAGKLGLPGSSAVLSDVGDHAQEKRNAPHAVDGTSSLTMKQEKDRQRKGAAIMKSVSQARKAMESMNMLAEAMTSVQGRSGPAGPGAPGEQSSAADGASGKNAAEDAEWGVFKDMVTRALSDQVVAWQSAHTEVSRDLVAANLRVAEDAMLIEQLKAEHDKLQTRVRQLSKAQSPAARDPPTPSTPGRNSSAGKGGRLSFLGRLTTPRHT